MKNSDKHRSTQLKAKHPVFLPGIKMNVYNSEQIKALGGIDAFNQAIGNDKPIPVPKIDFSEQAWEEMTQFLD